MKQNLIFSFIAILAVTFMAQFAFAQSTQAPPAQQDSLAARKYRLDQKRKQYEARQKQLAAPVAYPDVEDPIVEKSPFKFTTAVSIAYEQSAEENTAGIINRGLGLTIVPKFVFWDFSLRADLIYAYDLNRPRPNSSWADGIISLMYDAGFKLAAVKFSPYTSVELPMSRESRENREIELVNNVGVLATLDTKSLGVEKLSLSYSVAYGYFTNKYTTRVNGEPATEYKIVQNFKVGYKFNPISIGARFQFTNSYSYDDVARSGFLISESIAYQYNETLGFSLYHYNRAPFLKDSTYENNLQAYDKETSTVGFSTDIAL